MKQSTELNRNQLEVPVRFGGILNGFFALTIKKSRTSCTGLYIKAYRTIAIFVTPIGGLIACHSFVQVSLCNKKTSHVELDL